MYFSRHSKKCEGQRNITRMPTGSENPKFPNQPIGLGRLAKQAIRISQVKKVVAYVLPGQVSSCSRASLKAPKTKPRIIRVLTSVRKSFLQYSLHQMLVFCGQRSRSRPTNDLINKWHENKHGKSHLFLVQGAQQALKIWIPNRPEISKIDS